MQVLRRTSQNLVRTRSLETCKPILSLTISVTHSPGWPYSLPSFSLLGTILFESLPHSLLPVAANVKESAPMQKLSSGPCNVGGARRDAQIIAVIPTRVGSVRIKDKNTRPFAGTTLLSLTIKKLKSVPGIKTVLISSNDPVAKTIADSFDDPRVVFEQRAEKYCTSQCLAAEWNCELARTVIKHGG